MFVLMSPDEQCVIYTCFAFASSAIARCLQCCENTLSLSLPIRFLTWLLYCLAAYQLFQVVLECLLGHALPTHVWTTRSTKVCKQNGARLWRCVVLWLGWCLVRNIAGECTVVSRLMRCSKFAWFAQTLHFSCINLPIPRILV